MDEDGRSTGPAGGARPTGGPAVGPAAAPRVRPMAAEDLDAALALLAEVAAEGIWLGTEEGFDRAARRRAWSAGLARAQQRALVVEEGTTLVGHGSVTLAPYGVAELGMSLVVGARGRGVGGVLLDALLRAARDLGAHKVELQVWPHNEAAVRLYLSRGFAVEGRLRRHYRRSSGELWDAILMGLDLGLPGSSSGLADAPALPRWLDLGAAPG